MKDNHQGENHPAPKNLGAGQKWRRMKNKDAAEVEDYLRYVENNYITACARFICRDTVKDHVWTLRNNDKELSALIVHTKSTMIPVLCGKKEIPRLSFLESFLYKKKIHSVQGLKEEVIIMENALKLTGRRPCETIDYDLMHLDKITDYITEYRNYYKWPKNFVLYVPKLTDLDQMAAIQAAYEKEEVLPKNSSFSPAASRVNIANIIMREHVLAAEINGLLVGKINISQVSFTRYMIGGVYVCPEFRRQGIARRLTADFVHGIVSQGIGVSLFVKKSNLAARKLYAGLGFQVLGEYRINYY
jgi:ribosomal protein S18 acetylase RimI-like enzyme